MPESSIVVRPEQKESANYTASSRLQAAGLTGAMAIFEEAASMRAAAEAAAADRHRRLRGVDRPQLPAADRRGNRRAAQADPARPFDPRRAHRCSGQRLHRDVPDARRRSGQLSEQGRGDIRLGGRAIVLRTDHAVEQRESGLEFMVDSVAEPGSVADPRPHPGRLQRRRGRARHVREAGRTRLARVRRVPRQGIASAAAAWW